MNPPPPTQPNAVALAILYQGDRYLMQLRDDIPTIAYPGVWAFFGGHIEPNEDPATAVIRELQEEIGYLAPTVTFWGCYDDELRFYPDPEAAIGKLRYIFYAPLTVGLETLCLNEGWDWGLLSREDIDCGEFYSAQAQQTRPLGAPHRQLLLRFIAELAG